MDDETHGCSLQMSKACMAPCPIFNIENPPVGDKFNSLNTQCGAINNYLFNE